MNTNTQKRSKKEEARKVAVRVLCLVLAGLMALTALVSLINIL